MTVDSGTLAVVSAAAGLATTLIGGLAAMLSAVPAEPDDDWLLTWQTLPADVRTWVAEQYAAVELPAPVLPSRPSPTRAELR